MQTQQSIESSSHAAIPIVFTFDNQLVDPAIVCISSLLWSRNQNTNYEIHLLYIDLHEENQTRIRESLKEFTNFTIQFTDCNAHFDFMNASESRGITKTAYLRLLIPRLLRQHERVIYSDVDVIIQQDLSCLLNWSGFEAIYGIRAGDEKGSHDKLYKERIGCDAIDYINSGILVFNNQAIGDDEINQCLALISKGFNFHDQDIINLVFKGKIDASMHPKFAIIPGRYKSMRNEPEKWTSFYTSEQLSLLSLNEGIIHYAGRKPWNTRVDFGEIWWASFLKSSVVDIDKYNHYVNHLAFLPFDKTPLVKLIKRFK